MIPKMAIDAFLARQLNDSSKVKQFIETTIDAKLAALTPPPTFHTPPRFHQKASFLLGVKYPQYLFLLDPGLGKSKLSLDLAAYYKQLGQVKRCLVLVPNSPNIYSWKVQAKTHTPDLTVTGIDGNGPDEREAQWQSGAEITISTYMGLLNRVCSSKPGKKEKGWQIDSGKLKQIAKLFQMIVLDEITAAANHQSLTHKVCRALQPFCPYRYGLTGTPFGVDVQPLWGEFFLIDKGETLGETLGLFRACFFTEKTNYFTGFPEYKFNPKRDDDLHRTMQHRSIRYRESECLDLPPVVEKRVVVQPSVEQLKYLDYIMRGVVDSKGSPAALENIFHRMRMLSRGFLISRNEETDERETAPMDDNPALDALIGEIREIPLDEKIVVFHYYNLTGFSVSERLKKEKLKHVHLWSGSRDKQGIQQRFNEDEKCRVMLSSPAGAYGNNWQRANRVFFYETPTDPKLRLQMWKRCHRDGQTRRVFVTDIVLRKMIDGRILKALASNFDLFRRIVNGSEEL